MDSPSALKRLGQWVDLSCKFILTLAAGSMIAGLVSAGMHGAAVQRGLAQAERLFDQGRLEEADRLLAGLVPWARCFPGRYRECAALRVRCLARSAQAEAAEAIAESMRGECDAPVPRPGWERLPRNPLGWLHQTTLSLVSGLMGGLYPPTLNNPWAGYEALIEELTAVEDRNALSPLADRLLARFPQSLISFKAASARAALAPPPPSPPPAAPPNSRKPAPAPAAIDRAMPETVEATELPASWGIVTNTRAMACNPQTGLPVRELKPGDVLAIEGTGLIRKAPVLTGTLILHDRNVSNLAFQAQDLEIRKGSFASVPPREVALRSRLAEIAVEENRLQLRLAREKSMTPPEEKAYREAQTRFEAFQAEAAALTAQMNRKSGAERMRLLDRLRSMKYQEQTLLRTLSERKQAFEKTGGQTGAANRLAGELAALLQEKQAILQRLAAPPS